MAPASACLTEAEVLLGRLENADTSGLAGQLEQAAAAVAR